MADLVSQASTPCRIGTDPFPAFVSFYGKGSMLYSIATKPVLEMETGTATLGTGLGKNTSR